MFINCDCPPLDVLECIPDFQCGLNFGQIVKFAYRRKTTNPWFANQTDPLTSAAWTALFNQTDDTKVVVSPFCENLIIPAIEKITDGGNDNTTTFGIADVVGTNTPDVTGDFRSIPSDVLRALKTLNCEGRGSINRLEIVLINEFGQYIGDGRNTAFTGFDAWNFFIGDGGSEGKNTKDKTMFSWSVMYGWRDYAVKLTPTDHIGYNLVNPSCTTTTTSTTTTA